MAPAFSRPGSVRCEQCSKPCHRLRTRKGSGNKATNSNRPSASRCEQLPVLNPGGISHALDQAALPAASYSPSVSPCHGHRLPTAPGDRATSPVVPANSTGEQPGGNLILKTWRSWLRSSQPAVMPVAWCGRFRKRREGRSPSQPAPLHREPPIRRPGKKISHVGQSTRFSRAEAYPVTINRALVNWTSRPIVSCNRSRRKTR